MAIMSSLSSNTSFYSETPSVRARATGEILTSTLKDRHFYPVYISNIRIDHILLVYFGDPLRGLYPRQRVSVVPLPGLWNIRPLVCFSDTATFGVPMR
jgi:hypothetical protein